MTPPWCHGDVMDLTPFVEQLRRELALAAAAGGEEARALAERLTAPLESSVRLALLSALSAAAEELTGQLAPGSVDVRLRGGDIGFVVTPPPAEVPHAAPAPEAARPAADAGRQPRITLPPPAPATAGAAGRRSAPRVGPPSGRGAGAGGRPAAAARRSTPGWCGPSPTRWPA